MNDIVKPITADGRTGFDKFGQLFTWSLPDADGYKTGHVIRDVRDCKCYICDKTWGNTTEELQDQFFDEGRVMHETCWNGYRKINAHRDIQNALISAGFLFKLEEVPPRYPHSTPWQRVTVLQSDENRSDSGFKIVLGRRKRVWDLHIHRIGRLDADFTDVTDTKGYSPLPDEDDPDFGPYYFVHAWTREQLVDYLSRFRRAIEKNSGLKCTRMSHQEFVAEGSAAS